MHKKKKYQRQTQQKVVTLDKKNLKWWLKMHHFIIFINEIPSTEKISEKP